MNDCSADLVTDRWMLMNAVNSVYDGEKTRYGCDDLRPNRDIRIDHERSGLAWSLLFWLTLTLAEDTTTRLFLDVINTLRQLKPYFCVSSISRSNHRWCVTITIFISFCRRTGGRHTFSYRWVQWTAHRLVLTLVSQIKYWVYSSIAS